jgi:hypothetical protein
MADQDTKMTSYKHSITEKSDQNIDRRCNDLPTDQRLLRQIIEEAKQFEPPQGTDRERK